MQLRTNTMAINAMRNISIAGAGMAQAASRLASGFRINRAADDPSGLAISESMRAQIRGLDQASRNAQTGTNLLRTADGALTEIQAMLQRINEIIIAAANDTNNLQNREALQLEVNQLMAEIDGMSARATFNNRQLFSGDYAVGANHGGLWIQTGANHGQGMRIFIEEMGVNAIDAATEGSIYQGSPTGPGMDPNFEFRFANLMRITDADDPSNNQDGFQGMTGADIARFSDVLGAAINHVSLQRASIGAMENRLEFTIRNLDQTSENLTDAESRIRSADMALEMMRFVRYQVLQQTGMMVLAQANRRAGIFVELLS